MKKIKIYYLLTIVLLLGITITATAQVTIGGGFKPQNFSVLELTSESTKGGLRLPHLSTAERNTLSATQAFQDEKHRKDLPTKDAGLGLGLTIYNTDTNCIEYWDGYKWVSLCLGNASIELSNYPQPPLPPGGGETLPMVPTEEPKCMNSVPYNITVVVGETYASVFIIDPSTGEFKVNMQPNPTAISRIAIVRLMNSCTGEYKEFVFNQEGNTGICDNLSAKPVLTASNGGVICGTGNSIILGVTNPVVGATYIWVRNDNEEVGRGEYVFVNQAGNYKVYAGGIGCSGNDVSAPIAVTINGAGTAPSQLTIIADNGAVVCSGAPVTLTVKDFGSVTGTVYWYKNGIQYGTGQSVTTTSAGNFVAVLSQSGCTSNPSNTITTTTQSGTSTNFTKADIEINGKILSLGDPMLCNGGWLNMKIVNIQAGYTYKWVVNGIQVGAGTTCNYQVPGNAGNDFNLSIIAESGVANSCPTAITIASTISNNVPLNAAITGSMIFCNNVPGGAQLNTTVGGATYVWNNLTTGQSLNTGINNSHSALQGGKYEVIITTNEGCVSVSPAPHDVEMVGSPALTWTGGVLASVVGANEKVTFVVKNVGAPVTQGYTWTSSTSTGTANAVVSAGATDAAEITFTGNGVVTLTIVGNGFCGNSAPLTIDVTVNGVKPDMPIIVTPPATNVCGGWLFQIEEGTITTPGTLKYYEDKYGTNFTITWNEVVGAGNTVGTGPKIVSGANGRFCYIPFTQVSGSKAVMTATCTSGGVVSDPSAARTVNGEVGVAQTYSIRGQICFDVKQTNWPGLECGVWAQRTETNFDLLYEYELMGTLLPTNATQLTWSLDDPNNLVETTDYTTLNKAKLKIRDLRQHPSIKGSTTGLSFTINVTFTVNNGGCSSTYNRSIEVNIRDCDCCITVTDVDNLTYSAHQFGNAGCWMTENLATTNSPKNTPIQSSIPFNGNATKVKPKASGGEGWGRFYGWGIAMNGSGFETIGTGVPSGGKSTVQGICPDGWVVPSDYDWNMLEKEIATNPMAYSSNTKEWTWDSVWQTSSGIRPYNEATSSWGESMKSSRVVAGLTNANGKSNTDGTGFDVLMLVIVATDSSTWLWTSSNQSSSYHWARRFEPSNTSVSRSSVSGAGSVRCKKAN